MTLRKLLCKRKDRVATEDKTISFMKLTLATVDISIFLPEISKFCYIEK